MRSSIKKLVILPTLIFSVMSFSQNSLAVPICQSVHTEKLRNVSTKSASRQVQQLMVWEQTSNQARWEKPQEAMEIEFVSVPKSAVNRRVGQGASDKLLRVFGSGDTLNWYRHPLNQSDSVPYRQDPRSGFIWGHYSASRSLFVMVDGELYSFKLGTDHPHPKASSQPGKADLLNDSDISMRRSAHIRSFDQQNPVDAKFYILTEVFSLASSKNGFSVRDLRPLQDGNFYMPAFSIPYAGRDVAKKTKTDFDALWAVNYGESLGRAKALLALRYGLQMKTPNAQNWLVQLDKQGRPTGKIFMRDVADSNYIDFIAQHIAPEQLKADKDSSYTVATSLSPNWENSAWQMDEGNVSSDTLRAWGNRHNRAYINTFRDQLHISQDFQTTSELNSYLKSEDGQKALKEYNERLKGDKKLHPAAA